MELGWIALATMLVSVGACGGASPSAAAPAPSAAPSASSPPDDAEAAAKRAALTQSRAREIGAAAVTWRRGHAGVCPTTKDLTDKYAFAPDMENDASGAPFAIECADAEIRVLATGRAIVHVEPYSVAIPAPPNDPLPAAPPAGASVPDTVRATILPRMRSCYNAALKRDPNVSGTVHGTIVIAPNGSVKSLTFDPKTTTIRDPDFLACARNAMRSAQFEPSSEGDRVVSF